MTDTPQTDNAALIWERDNSYISTSVPIEFARDLEWLVADHQRWLRDMVEDYKLAHDDFTASRRVAINSLIHRQRDEIAQLKAAIELGQINCDAVYEDLRNERDAARSACLRAYKFFTLRYGIDQPPHITKELRSLAIGAGI